MKYLKNIESDSIMPFILGTGLILIILSFLAPFPVILFFQDMLFFSYDHLTFIRPKAAYLGFSLGMIWMAIVLFSFLLTKMYAEKREHDYKLTALHLILFLASFIIFACSISHYHYLDQHGVHSQSFWTFSEEKILWKELEDVSRLVREDNYEVLSYTFSSKDAQITIPYDTQDIDTSRAIYGLIDRFKWDVVDQFTDD